MKVHPSIPIATRLTKPLVSTHKLTRQPVLGIWSKNPRDPWHAFFWLEKLSVFWSRFADHGLHQPLLPIGALPDAFKLQMKHAHRPSPNQYR